MFSIKGKRRIALRKGNGLMKLLKKELAWALAVCTLVVSLAGCSSQPATSPATTTPVTEESTMPVFKDGMDLLAIGHSNTCMSTYELCKIFDNLGYENFNLGVLWRGDSNFKVHTNLANTNQAGVVYHKPTLEKFSDPSDTEKLTNYRTVLKDREWDAIVIYQGGPALGDEGAYDPYLKNLIRAIKRYCPNAKIYYGIMWAYPTDSKTPGFVDNYGADQMTMHNAAIEMTKKMVVGTEGIDGIIPLATLIQSLRTKYGEAFHVADRVHINTTGSYVVGLMWYAALTGLPLDELSYLPSGVNSRIAQDAKALIPQILKDPYTIIDISEE